MFSSIKNSIFLLIVSAATVIIVFSFFMPWVSATTSIVRVSKQVTNAIGPLGELPFVGEAISGLKEGADMIRGVGDIDINTVISGYNIPRMVNSKSSKAALSFARNFFKDTEGLGRKSLLVYLLPLLAILCTWLAFIGIKYRPAVISTLIISGIISLYGLYNLSTFNFSNEVVDIVILKWLWYTMYGYLAIFIVSVLWIAGSLMGKHIK